MFFNRIKDVIVDLCFEKAGEKLDEGGLVVGVVSEGEADETAKADAILEGVAASSFSSIALERGPPTSITSTNPIASFFRIGIDMLPAANTPSEAYIITRRVGV